MLVLLLEDLGRRLSETRLLRLDACLLEVRFACLIRLQLTLREGACELPCMLLVSDPPVAADHYWVARFIHTIRRSLPRSEAEGVIAIIEVIVVVFLREEARCHLPRCRIAPRDRAYLRSSLAMLCAPFGRRSFFSRTAP